MYKSVLGFHPHVMCCWWGALAAAGTMGQGQEKKGKGDDPTWIQSVGERKEKDVGPAPTDRRVVDGGWHAAPTDRRVAIFPVACL